MIVLTPTHRLAREIKQRNVEACTYHSFFQYKGDEWTPERMGEKFIPEIIIWDEICTVSVDVLKVFLDWLLQNNTNTVYLAVSRVRRINQLRRIVFDDNDTIVSDAGIVDVKIIDKKLSGYKQQDKKKGEFDIDAELIIAMKQQQNNHHSGWHGKLICLGRGK